MKNIITNDEEINDLDASDFYDFLSQFIGRRLDPNVDKITLSKPYIPTRNSKEYMIYCQIGEDRRVAFKRCSDNPEFIRRELTTAQAQAVLGFPTYKITKKEGITLRNQITGKTCKIFSGWEKKTFLVIDYGNSNLMMELKHIEQDKIEMTEFLKNYGKWASLTA